MNIYGLTRDLPTDESKFLLSPKDRVSPVALKALEEGNPSTSVKKDHKFSIGMGALSIASIAAGILFANPLLIAVGFLLTLVAAYCFVQERVQKDNVVVDPTFKPNKLLSDSYGLQGLSTSSLGSIDSSPDVTDPVTFTLNLLEDNYKEENGEFSVDELGSIHRKRTGDFPSPFKDFDEFLPFQYRMTGCNEVSDQAYPETLFRSYVSKVLGLNEGQDAVARMQDCLNDPATRNKALRLHAFFKLLGNQNHPLPNDGQITETLMHDAGSFLNTVPTRVGRLSRGFEHFDEGFVTFRVRGEEVELKTLEQKKIATLKTSRTVNIQQPDAAGNVAYTIRRHFEEIT